MFLVSVLRNALLVLVPLSSCLSSYLYLYPVFHQCAFPSPERSSRSAYVNTVRQHAFPFAVPSAQDSIDVAQFRLLALGDPQLEGDSSIPDPEAVTFPNLSKFWKDSLLLNGTEHDLLQRVRHSLHDLIDFYLDDIPKALEVYRKRLDHIGNDFYLGHIYRTLYWWTNPTHVTVLGDLVGSQWICDDEFESRGWRFWNRVFKHGQRISDDLASQPSANFQDTLILGDDADGWKRRIINVAGNHDIGYAGDLSRERIVRFERVFGKANYELRFQLPVSHAANSTRTDVEVEDKAVPELRIVILNDMNLDAPVSSKELQDETYKFLNDIITTSHDVTRPAHFTLVLTHIPMFKEAGICVDGPFFDFFDGQFENGIKEQNHISEDSSKGILEGLFGMHGSPSAPGYGFGRNGLILAGHDHEGCDVYHYINQSSDPERRWQAEKWEKAQRTGITDQPGVPGVREVTVRSMMGDFAGNAGLLSLWFDYQDWDWKFEFANCSLGTQHIWWVVHILDLITLCVGVGFGVVSLLQRIEFPDLVARPKQRHQSKGKGTEHISKEKDGGIKNEELASALKSQGKLVVPGDGKKSLRKKKSRRALNVDNHIGSVVHAS